MESIYFAVAPTGLIKVGRSNDVPQRMTTLGTVLISQFVGVAAYERRVHAALSASHVEGEWFKPSEEVMALAASKSSSALLDKIGVSSKRVFDPSAGTEKDREDLAEAARMIEEGKALRRRVQARIRTRRHRNKSKEQKA